MTIDQNRFVAGGLILTIIACILTAAFAGEETANQLYTLEGLGLFLFGTWAAILLLKK